MPQKTLAPTHSGKARPRCKCGCGQTIPWRDGSPGLKQRLYVNSEHRAAYFRRERKQVRPANLRRPGQLVHARSLDDLQKQLRTPAIGDIPSSEIERLIAQARADIRYRRALGQSTP